ncbi:MAG: hypothetical protein K2X69_09230 [Silvanigrellaceae bacterium]|nr:hypothetical protein [Silvanigrellaceae bacterium]
MNKGHIGLAIKFINYIFMFTCVFFIPEFIAKGVDISKLFSTSICLMILSEIFIKEYEKEEINIILISKNNDKEKE